MKLGPPKPPPKTAFSASDVIRGPDEMLSKFQRGPTPDIHSVVNI